MKKIITYCLVALITAFNFSNAQSPYKLDIEQEVIGTDLHMSLYATKLNGNDFSFSSCNFAVIIDTANLDLVNATKIADGIWDNDTDPQSYLDVVLGKGPNFINVSSRRNTSGNGSGQIVPTTKTLIAEIMIPIKNQCATNTSTWVILPAAQNKFPLQNIKQDAQFVNPTPNFPLCVSPAEPNLIYNGNDTICEGETALLSTTATGDLQWYLNGVALIGEDGQTLVASATGNYTVESINCICKTISSMSQEIFINPLPENPIVSQNGNSLQINPTDAQIFWYKDGDLFASNTIMIDNLQDGVYTVMLKNSCGDKLSEPIEIITSSVSADLENSFTAFPNPFKESSQIKLTLTSSKNMSLKIYNVLGEEIVTLMEGNKSAGEYIFSFDTKTNQASDGVYLAKLMIDDEEARVLKLVEIK